MRFLAALLFLLLSVPALAQTGSVRTQSQMSSEIGTTGCTQNAGGNPPTCLYPDNAQGLITPLLLRQGLQDLNATVFGSFPSSTIVVPNAGCSSTYSIQSTDFGHQLVSSCDASHPVTFILPNQASFYVRILNVGNGPLFVQNNTAGFINNFFKQTQLTQSEGAAFSSNDGLNWSYDLYPSNLRSGYGNLRALGYTLSGGGAFITLNGTVTSGEVIGISLLGQTVNYTFTTNSNTEFLTAAKALVTSLRNNTSLQAQVGDGLQFSTSIPQTDGVHWTVSIELSQATCSTTPTVTNSAHVTLGVSAFSCNLAERGFLSIGGGSIWNGRQPAAGDGIGGIFFCGEWTGIPFDPYDCQPFYSSIQSSVIDPAVGVGMGKMSLLSGQIALIAASSNSALGGTGNCGTLGPISTQPCTLTLQATNQIIMSGSNINMTGSPAPLGHVLRGNGTQYVDNTPFVVDAGDYAQGTFSPVLAGSTVTGTCPYSFQIGSYEKIGRTVNIRITLAPSGACSGLTGNLQIQGLPFTAAGVPGENGNCAIGAISGWTGATGFTSLAAQVAPSNSTIVISENGSGKTNQLTPVSEWTLNSSLNIQVSCNYHT